MGTITEDGQIDSNPTQQIVKRSGLDGKYDDETVLLSNTSIGHTSSLVSAGTDISSLHASVDSRMSTSAFSQMSISAHSKMSTPGSFSKGVNGWKEHSDDFGKRIPRTIELSHSSSAVPKEGKIYVPVDFKRNLEKTLVVKQSLRELVYREILLLQPEDGSDWNIPYCACSGNTAIEESKEIHAQNTSQFGQKSGGIYQGEHVQEKDIKNTNWCWDKGNFGDEEREAKEDQEITYAPTWGNETPIHLTAEPGSDGDLFHFFVGNDKFEVLQTIWDDTCGKIVSQSALTVGEEMEKVIETSISVVGNVSDDYMHDETKEAHVRTNEEFENFEEALPVSVENKVQEQLSKTKQKLDSMNKYRQTGTNKLKKKAYTSLNEIIPHSNETNRIGLIGKSPDSFINSGQSVGLSEMEGEIEREEYQNAYRTIVTNSINKMLNGISTNGTVNETLNYMGPLVHNIGENVENVIEKTIKMSNSTAIGRWVDNPLSSID
uniref:Uncharacterized protein n=1 Tax=Corethron hystrix TaxID=216773 RepID=A0A7S1C1K7_9STRA|mmetsp:Transcript_8964/g.19813  ORF Transcript_8964/g.19813 Transcript_8964/m.19813 type:complete len:490 (+) Transcript_8964:254-1723(+)